MNQGFVGYIGFVSFILFSMGSWLKLDINLGFAKYQLLFITFQLVSKGCEKF